MFAILAVICFMGSVVASACNIVVRIRKNTSSFTVIGLILCIAMLLSICAELLSYIVLDNMTALYDTAKAWLSISLICATPIALINLCIYLSIPSEQSKMHGATPKQEESLGGESNP